MTYTLHLGDCLEVMKTFDDNSIDAIVSDPPYGLSFMGKEWDHGVPGVAFWVEALRVLKPGGHLLAFGGTRTYHRLVVAIEDAGFEIRDCLQWIYGSGFPKSHNLHDAWHGWGTALKPSWEPIVMARKPLRGTVADNVQAWGTGALNIDGCRIGEREKERFTGQKRVGTFGGETQDYKNNHFYEANTNPLPPGRWPSNTLLDEEAAAMLDEQSGISQSTPHIQHKQARQNIAKGFEYERKNAVLYTDTGGASRFFYVAKASAAERDAGLEDMEEKRESDRIKSDGVGGNNPRNHTNTPRQNHHPTVKPITLMRYLVRMVTPPGGVVLDPFMGSGSTGCGAIMEGFDFVGIDITPEYVEIAGRRIAYYGRQPRLL